MLYCYYNYYSDSDPLRKMEIDSCLRKLTDNKAIDKLFVITESSDPLPVNSSKIEVFQQNMRPEFADFFSIAEKESSESDINVILNSDCYFTEKSVKYINTISLNEAYCISRIEVNSAYPHKVNKLKSIKNWKKNSDTQDCWIFRGKPKNSMILNYYMGKPGCDNRLAHELQNAGYTISNPRTEISIYHFHLNAVQKYTNSERVPGPYAFPVIKNSKIFSHILFKE